MDCAIPLDPATLLDPYPSSTGYSNKAERSIFVKFVDNSGESTGSPVWLPLDSGPDALTNIINELLIKDDSDPAFNIYEFFIGRTQILDDLATAISQSRSLAGEKLDDINLESIVSITYQVQAAFRVRPVTRCSSSLPGHTGAILVALFSPDARILATGSGDASVRFWDLTTELASATCSEAHRAPVLCLAWSPDSIVLASGCQGGAICLWKEDNNSWKLLHNRSLERPSLSKSPLASKSRWIRSIAWRPIHIDAECRMLAVAYQESSIVIWDALSGQPKLTLTGHQKPVTFLRWGGSDLIYSASQDTTIRVWRPEDGVLCRILNLHGHWVNCLALSTDYVLRTGPFDPAKAVLVKLPPTIDSTSSGREKLKERAKVLYERLMDSSGIERLAACSDDHTLSLWQPSIDKNSICPRMTGHQGVVNDVKFSYDSRILASASFDHSVKIWDGHTGQFLATLFGHVQDVYLVAWSSDSRLLVSGSKDSTLKLWSMNEIRRWQQEAVAPGLSDQPQAKKWKVSPADRKLEAENLILARDGTKSMCKQKSSTHPNSPHQRKRHLVSDLPGHADAVYALDWSPDGLFVASGGKDKLLKLWKS